MGLKGGTFRCLHAPICILFAVSFCSTVFPNNVACPPVVENLQTIRKVNSVNYLVQEKNSSNKWPTSWVASPRAATVAGTNFWPGAVVYFSIHQSLAVHREVIFEAFNEYHQNTCIQFRKCQQCSHYIQLIRAKDSDKCSSNIGLLKTNRPQNVKLGANCMHVGIIIHELAHALGLIHEHQRPDRKANLIVHWENISENRTPQFVELPGVTTLSPFDFQAITLYESNAFSNNSAKDTITPKNSNVTLPHSSNKPGLSQYDIASLNNLYNCTTLDTNSE